MRQTRTSQLLLVSAALLSASRVCAQGAESEDSLEHLDVDFTDEPEPEPVKDRAGLVVIPRLGVVVFGSGTFNAKLDCESSVLCPLQSSESRDRDYDDRTVLLFELDLLYHLAPVLRLGGGVLWIPNSEAKIERGSKVEFGSELAPLAIIEGVFGNDVAGTVRGFIGPNFLFADGELEELVDDMDSACAELGRAGFSCNVESGPFVGLTLGAGAGVLGRLSEKVSMRGDITLQYLRTSGPSLEVSDDAGNGYLDSSRWSGTRLWLTVGLEF